MTKLQMSGSEIKLMLRKLDFPFSAREALTRVEQLILFLSGGKPPNSKVMESAMEITAEFVFCEVDRRGGKKRPFTKIQELQLMEVLCDHFLLSGSASGNVEGIRSYLFSALFPPMPPSPASPTPVPSANSSSGRTMSTWEARLSLLCKLVSLAVATRNVPLLTTAGVWMAQAGGGVTAAQNVRVVQCLVRDYIVLVPRSISRLMDLPFLAPLFAAHFLAAISEMYASLERGNMFTPPPDALLEMVTKWVSESANLCLGPLVSPSCAASTSQRSSTPPPMQATSSRVQMQPGQASPKMPSSSPSQMSCMPPFAALFKWCIIAPLHFYTSRPKKISSSSSTMYSRSMANSQGAFRRETAVSGCGVKPSSNDSTKGGEPELYSQLHLSLLQAMLNLFLEQGTNVTQQQNTNPKVLQQQQPRKQPPQPTISPVQLLPQLQSNTPLITPSEVISSSHLRAIADELEIHRRRICASVADGVSDDVDSEKEEVVQLALDRLGQALQVSLTTACLYGDRRELFERLSLLPHNRLINIVISKHSTRPG